jgi:hypothetical protein
MILHKQVVTDTKTTRTGTKLRAQQGKQIIRNANLCLIQDWKHKYVRQEHNICKRLFKHNFILITYGNKVYDKNNVPKTNAE